MSWVAVGVTAAGTLTKVIGDAHAKQKQNSILEQGSQQQSRAGMDAARTFGDFLQQLRGSAPNPDAERGAFTSAVNAPTMGGSAPAISGLITASPQFRAAAATANTGVQGYGANLADLFSRIRAPALQRQQENQLMIGAGDALRPIEQGADNDAYLARMRAGNAQPNPWLQLGGTLLQNYGQYLANKPSGKGGGGYSGMGSAVGGQYGSYSGTPA